MVFLWFSYGLPEGIWRICCPTCWVSALGEVNFTFTKPAGRQHQKDVDDGDLGLAEMETIGKP